MNIAFETGALLAADAHKRHEEVRQHLKDDEHKVVNFLDLAAEPDTIGEIASLRKRPTFKEPNLDHHPDDIKPVPRTVTFMPSQVGSPDQVSISYTATPFRLLWYDIQLVLGKLPSTMGVMKPWRWGKDADPYDEMYPNGRNLLSIAIHTILVVTQFIFIMTLPWHIFTPIAMFICYVACFVFFNTLASIALNGTEIKLLPQVNVDPEGKFTDEYWIYLNGVSVGRSWLQSNVNRLSITFGRPVVGVHNGTSGIIFDLFQCLLQRNFAYATQDVREAYACIKEALLDPDIKKIVFILHSQGGIEGGLILDWLFAEVSRDALKRMEVYTFGNAANHFNNPDLWDPNTNYGKKKIAEAEHAERAAVAAGVQHHGRPIRTKVIGHIEHYANAGDFVSQFGVLNYTRMQNRFMGRLFLAPGSGHLLNQHYLYKMFALNPERTACADTNEFMEMEVRFNKHDVEEDDDRESLLSCLVDRDDDDKDQKAKGVAFVGDVNAPVAPTQAEVMKGIRRDAKGPGAKLKVKDFSRLWLYRNGGEPED